MIITLTMNISHFFRFFLDILKTVRMNTMVSTEMYSALNTQSYQKGKNRKNLEKMFFRSLYNRKCFENILVQQRISNNIIIHQVDGYEKHFSLSLNIPIFRFQICLVFPETNLRHSVDTAMKIKKMKLKIPSKQYLGDEFSVNLDPHAFFG